MCGIAGFTAASDITNGKATIGLMTDALAHRGPDAGNTWNDDAVFLGHRRLSIIDLSESSNQPMSSTNDRYVIVYNGELYNYRELKLELQRVAQGSGNMPYFFRTNSDTEVILAAYQRWGTDCLSKFNGMFAFAIYDREEKSLFIARDRLGIKPLYYSLQDKQLVFASEIRSLLRSGRVEKKLDRRVLQDYFLYQTVHAPLTIIENVSMLMPGHFMIWKDGGLRTWRYWSNEVKKEKELSYAETCKTIEELLYAAVERRLVADVPFGAFLSGGIDSSAVVGIMSRLLSQKPDTFNVSFDESEFSEAVYAKKIAEKFNTRHHEIKLSPAQFLEQLPEALKAMDHPGGDGPNTYIVSKATKQAGITMALSGLGGDELFAGYDVFKRMIETDKKAYLNAFPQWLRSVSGAAVSARKRSVAGDKIRDLLSQQRISMASAYAITRKVFSDRQLSSLLHADKQEQTLQKFIASVSAPDAQHKLSYVSQLEIGSYMQNVLLRDADQMSMAVALEVRVPFLDYKLVDFALSVKDDYKYPHSPKKLLIDSLKDLLPDEVVNRPKMGFTLPWKHWLKHELNSFCDEKLRSFMQRDFVKEQGIKDLWNNFLKDDPRISWSRVWHLVVLENWLQANDVN